MKNFLLAALIVFGVLFAIELAGQPGGPAVLAVVAVVLAVVAVTVAVRHGHR